MLLTGFPAIVLGTNCYLMATAPGCDCVIVDPGIGVHDRLGKALSASRLNPVAVVLTHGHLDHVYGAHLVSEEFGVPVYIHAADRYRLADPISSLDPGLLQTLAPYLGGEPEWREPRTVREFVGEDVLELAGLRLRILHAPGHTEGSVLVAVDDLPRADHDVPHIPGRTPESPGGQAVTSTVLSGDVLFAGSVGRTDLPGGDPSAMARTLRETVLTLPDDVLILPGHGEATTLGRERRGNPFLRDLALAQE
jgi:hydroxyacylglutathione hydrolase